MIAQTYVELGPFTANKLFDAKLKPVVIKALSAAAEKGLAGNSSFTTKKPTDKDAQGLFVGGGVESLESTTAGNQVTIEAKLSLQIGFWPKHEMKAFPKGGAKVTGGTHDKIESLAADAVTSVMEVLMKKVITELVNEAKQLPRP